MVPRTEALKLHCIPTASISLSFSISITPSPTPLRYLDLPDLGGEWEDEDRANNAVGGSGGGGGGAGGPAAVGGCPREGVHRVGELIVPLPRGGDATHRVVCVKMLFGRTEIAATAWDEETQEVQQVQVKFACSS